MNPSSPTIRTSDVSIIISLTSFSFLAFYSSILQNASYACDFLSFAVPFQSHAVPCAPLLISLVPSLMPCPAADRPTIMLAQVVEIIFNFMPHTEGCGDRYYKNGHTCRACQTSYGTCYRGAPLSFSLWYRCSSFSLPACDFSLKYILNRWGEHIHFLSSPGTVHQGWNFSSCLKLLPFH